MNIIIIIHAIMRPGFRVEVNLRALFLTSVLKKGKWSVLDPCRFNPDKKAPAYPLHRRLGEPQCPYTGAGEKINFLPMPSTEPRFLGCLAYILVTTHK